jgi:chaperonin GroEL
MNKVYGGEQARKLILDGARQLFEAVRETYGPTSGNVGILRNLSGLDITHDGVTVARNIDLAGPERAGAEVIKNTAIKMDKELGDGTTTVIILAFSIIEAVQDALMMGKSPIKIKDALQEEAKLAISKLDELTHKEVTLDVLKQVATISASDKVLGEKVAEIVYAIGVDGNVTVEDGMTPEVEAEVLKGYTIDNGVASNYMITDATTISTTVENAHILVVNQKIDNYERLLHALKTVEGAPLFIIANDMTDPVLSAMVGTNHKGLTNVTFVKSPRFGSKRLEYLNDIAAIVGTQVVDGKQVGFDVKLGIADKIIANLDKTIIIGGGGDINDRKKIIQGQIKSADSDFDKEEAEQRLAALEGKAAVIRVGGLSDDEVNEKRYRIDDAIFACQAALRSGVVAGGATTPLDLAQYLPDDSILKEVLQKPFKVLLENVGLNPEDYKPGNGSGVNTRTGDTVDLFKEGIIEPAETIKKAIESAVSVAGTAITMKVLIVDEEDKDE